jgi:hypothetical protein
VRLGNSQTAQEDEMAMPQASVAFRNGLEVVRAVEPRIAEAISDELDSQRHQLKLIASENYASPAVLLAMGNWLSDKYAEGTPGHRFYAGCEVVDRSRPSPTTTPRRCSAPTTPMSSRTPGSTPTWSGSGRSSLGEWNSRVSTSWALLT